jgi:hypothetical protein
MELLLTAGAGLLLLSFTSQGASNKPQIEFHSETIQKDPPEVKKEVPESPYRVKTPQERINESKSKTVTLKMEPFCRSVIEEYYRAPFDKCSSAIKNPRTNHYLELDGYNKKLKIAFEYQGEQHYVFPNVFHSTREEFEQQLWRDHVKVEVCKRVGIKLIVIPYTIEYNTYRDTKGVVHLGKKRSKDEIRKILIDYLSKI